MRDLRCLLQRHDWVAVKTADGDEFAECTRCGKHDWQRLIPRREGPRWRGGGMPPWGDPGGH